MKTILVTGGAGYIGSHTVRELINQKYDVVVLDSMENGHKEAVDTQASLEIADLGDKSAIAAIFDKYQIDAIIDFAAYLSVGESMLEPEKYLKNNVLNFINLLDVMAISECKYIIKSSTAAVYGNPIKDTDIPWKESFIEDYKPSKSALLEGKWQNETVIGEDFLQKFLAAFTKNAITDHDLKLSDEEVFQLRIPVSVYGLSKLLDEIILKKYDEMRGIKSVALRYFNVCGADPKGDLGDDKPVPSNLMTLCMLQALGKIPEIKLFGRDYQTPDGTGVRDYIHPCDLATGHVRALEFLINENTSNVFNLGTGKGASVLEVITAIEKASGKKINTTDYSRRSGDPAISIANADKAKLNLEWEAKYNLDGMAETAWKWHSSHPDGFKR